MKPAPSILDPRYLATTDELCEALGIPFSDEQLAAICAPLDPNVIIAGAGSGKTTVMAARVVWLVGTGQVRPHEVLGLTFTRKAAGELADRIRDSLHKAGVVSADCDEDEEVVLTYDAFAARLVAEHGLRMGLEATPVMINDATRYRLCDRVVNAAAGPFKAISKLRPSTVVERVLKLDSELQSHLVSTQQIYRHAERLGSRLAAAPLNNRGNTYVAIQDAQAVLDERCELAGLVEGYRRLKAELGVSEFADQFASAARLVHSAPSVRTLLREQFKVVLLDEYQDTSSAQAQLLRGLFDGGHAVTAVGDPLQAIYGWRGAAASNILSFATDFPVCQGKPARTYHLAVNRRSQQQILDVANDLSSMLRSYRGTGTEVKPLRAPSGEEAGAVIAAGFETADEEVAWIAESIADQGREPAVDWSQTAVLVRRNADIPALYAALVARDVPVEIVGLGGLLLLPEVSVVVSMLHLLNDYASNSDLIALLSGPRWRIGPSDLEVLGRRAAELAKAVKPVKGGDDLASGLDQVLSQGDPAETACLYDALLDPGDAPLSVAAKQRMRAFLAELDSLRRHIHEPPAELVHRVITTIGLQIELAASEGSPGTDRQSQLAAFCETISTYVDVDGDASLPGLLAYLDAEVEHGVGLDQAVPRGLNAVKLLTVHKAKGLEWSRVYLPGLADKVFPSNRVNDNYLKQAASIPAPLRGDAGAIPQLAEVTNADLTRYAEELKVEQDLAEDRLGYVAVTRAKHMLIGSWHLWEPGRRQPCSPSRYFRMIEDEARRQGNVIAEAPPVANAKPAPGLDAEAAWPVPLDPASSAERERAASLVARYRGLSADSPPETEVPLSAEASAVVEGWDEDLALLVAEASKRADATIEVELPESMSVTDLIRLRRSPQTWARAQIRPMPRKPSRAADIGTQFHNWVQDRCGVPVLFDEETEPKPAPGPLERLQKAFEYGPYADRQPVAVEAPFVLRLGSHLVRGRIDAVYAAAGEYDFQVVDWKTSDQSADDLQLGLYRLAWARAKGIPPERVDAVFYHVPSGKISRPVSMPSESALATRFG